MLTAEQIIQILNLKPLPKEGGYYKETYRSAGSKATAIYYLLTSETFSAMHKLPSDEIYHFYLGDPVKMLLLYPDGTGKTITLGSDLLNGMLPQFVVPAGVWHGSRISDGGKFALMGTVMAPGFEFSKLKAGKREELEKQYPRFRDMIKELTRE